MMALGEVYPQSQAMPFTCSGRSSAAIITVAAPMEQPETRIRVSEPKRFTRYSTQRRQSYRSLTPSVITRP